MEDEVPKMDLDFEPKYARVYDKDSRDIQRKREGKIKTHEKNKVRMYMIFLSHAGRSSERG
jgi:hypothetical protein